MQKAKIAIIPTFNRAKPSSFAADGEASNRCITPLPCRPMCSGAEKSVANDGIGYNPENETEVLPPRSVLPNLAMTDHLLSFELDGDGSQLFIHGDPKGLKLLIRSLERLLALAEQGKPDHDHFMSANWSG